MNLGERGRERATDKRNNYELEIGASLTHVNNIEKKHTVFHACECKPKCEYLDFYVYIFKKASD